MKKRIAPIAVVAVVIAVIILLPTVFFPPPRVIVASATIPGTTINSGESAIIYRFAVSAERDDVEIEQIYLTFRSHDASLANLYLYSDNGSRLPGEVYYCSEGMIRYCSDWSEGAKIVVPEGTTQIFNLRANVIGQGTISIRIEEMELWEGSVEELPSATITLTIK